MHAEATTADAVRRTFIPAWMMSLVLHLILLVLLGVTVGSTATSAPDESTREVGIVLAHRQPSERFAYYDEAEEPEQQAEQAMQDATTTSSAAAANGNQRPIEASDPSSLLIPDIQLPGSASPAGSPDDILVHDLNLRGRGRRPILPGLDDEAILAEEAAMRAARPSLGPKTQVSLFGSAAAVGHSFVFAVDRSKSMGGSGLNALSAARVELSRTLTALKTNHRFQIIGYSHKCVYYNTTRLISVTEDNVAGVSEFVDRLAAFGGTSHDMALRAALAMEPDAVFLLTDGGDPHLNEMQLANIHKLAGRRTTIHCIQFGFGALGEEDNFMLRLARQNSGGYTYVNMSLRPGG